MYLLLNLTIMSVCCARFLKYYFSCKANDECCKQEGWEDRVGCRVRGFTSSAQLKQRDVTSKPSQSSLTWVPRWTRANEKKRYMFPCLHKYDKWSCVLWVFSSGSIADFSNDNKWEDSGINRVLSMGWLFKGPGMWKLSLDPKLTWEILWGGLRN